MEMTFSRRNIKKCLTLSHKKVFLIFSEAIKNLYNVLGKNLVKNVRTFYHRSYRVLVIYRVLVT